MNASISSPLGKLGSQFEKWSPLREEPLGSVHRVLTMPRNGLVPPLSRAGTSTTYHSARPLLSPCCAPKQDDYGISTCRSLQECYKVTDLDPDRVENAEESKKTSSWPEVIRREHRRARIALATDHERWTRRQWRRVLFTDEC